MKNVILQDIVTEFKKYKGTHPLKMMANEITDAEGKLDFTKMIEKSTYINSLNAIGLALSTLAHVSEVAYFDMVRNKLAAPHGNTYDIHNLISAFCELSVMFTFISRSSNPDSFVYEERMRKDSKKNVEFSIKMSDYIFHVEVKSSNLISEDNKIADLLKKNKEVYIADARDDNYKDLEEKVNMPVVGCLDRRISDYLKSADAKFIKTDNPKEINLLVICWDDRIQQPLIALKSKEHHGLFTQESFEKDADNKPLQYPNVDIVLVNSSYELFKRYLVGVLFSKDFSLNYPVNPFLQFYGGNCIIDYNLTEEIVSMINSILQNEVRIIDENFADKLKPSSIASFSAEDSDVIKFK